MIQFGLTVAFLFKSTLLNGMLSHIPTRVFDWVRAYRQFLVEFVTHVSSTWVFIKTWKSGEFVRVAVANIDQYYGDPNSELTFLVKVLCAVGKGASVNFICGGSHTLVHCYKEYLGSGYTKTTPCRLPHFRSAAFGKVPSKNCIGGLWDIRSLFTDRVHCYSFEGGGASRLDAIEAVSSNGHRNRRSVSSRTPRCRQ